MSDMTFWKRRLGNFCGRENRRTCYSSYSNHQALPLPLLLGPLREAAGRRESRQGAGRCSPTALVNRRPSTRPMRAGRLASPSPTREPACPRGHAPTSGFGPGALVPSIRLLSWEPSQRADRPWWPCHRQQLKGHRGHGADSPGFPGLKQVQAPGVPAMKWVRVCSDEKADGQPCAQGCGPDPDPCLCLQAAATPPLRTRLWGPSCLEPVSRVTRWPEALSGV